MTNHEDQTVIAGLALATFLDTEIGKHLADLPENTREWRAALGQREVVDYCRIDLARHEKNPSETTARAFNVLIELGRPWAGNHDGSDRHPDYLDAWLPDSYPKST